MLMGIDISIPFAWNAQECSGGMNKIEVYFPHYLVNLCLYEYQGCQHLKKSNE